jgi:hypothetical protein
MFTRQVIMKLKPDAAAEFTRIQESEVVPPLRSQKGLFHEETFISPEISEAVSNSFWATSEDAEAYNGAGYTAGLRALSSVIQGTPQVESFVISSSTFHRITARRREAHRRDNR